MNAPALLFPGQGAQLPGMGRELADTDAEAMHIWKQAEAASGLPLRAVYWEENDEIAMADTRMLQPALVAAELAVWLKLAPRLRPAAAAGHSLGEYCAFAASETLPLKTVLELAALRGRLMAEADPEGKGAMCAVVKLEQTEVETLVREVLEQGGGELRIANYNTPAQFVLSGDAAAIECAARLAGARKGRALPLKVSGAFHSPAMSGAAKELAGALRKAVWSRPRFPVYCNALGRAVTDGEGLKEAALIQMTSSVRWIETITAQWDGGIRCWLELGPKAVLSKMLSPILSTLRNAPQNEYSSAKVCTSEEIGSFSG